MAYVAYDARLAHSAPKTHRVPAGLYVLLGNTMTALVFAGWGLWMVNDVGPARSRAWCWCSAPPERRY